MIEIFIDFSLMYENFAFGRVSGNIKVPFTPNIGDTISFDFHSLNLDSVHEDGFAGISKVESRMIVPGKGVEAVVFGLESFSVSSLEAAQALMLSFEETYGLFGEPYEL